MKAYLQKVSERRDLTKEEASLAMRDIMDGNATEAQIGAFLIALKLKGEHPDEILGFVEVMREKSIKVRVDDPDAIDMCGTGGDNAGTFNISTIATFVVAGAGVTVAKHGNRSVSSSCGSADVLKALGINIDLPAGRVETCINKLGVGFLFAPLFHPAMKHASKPRAELGMKTCFNILGPMTNPADVKRQLVGAFDHRTSSIMAGVFSQLNPRRVCVVHAEDGLDEISLGAPTHVLEVNGRLSQKSYSVEAGTFGLPRAGASDIQGGNPERNASIAIDVLNGVRGPCRDTVIANAAMGLFVGGKVTSFEEGTSAAIESVDSGNALAKLIALKEITNA